MKRTIIKAATALLACIAFLAMTSEADTIGTQALISLGSMAVLYGCYRVLDRVGALGEDNH